MPDTLQRAMPVGEFIDRAKDLGRGFYRAVADTPARLRKLYSTPPASGPGGMKGIEDTAATGARGFGKVVQQIRALGK